MVAPIKVDPLDRPVTTQLRRDFVVLRSDQTVERALASLRGQTLGERVVYFYVVDDQGRLVGVAPTRRLLMSDVAEPIARIMQPNVISLPHTASLLMACELFVMHRLLALPVVDSDGKLIGIIDINVLTEEMTDLGERRSADDVFQLIGVRLAQVRSASPLSSYAERFPWLLCNIGGGTACALLAGLYESTLNLVIVLALFIPVVLALAESVSIQSMTLTLQALHGQRVDWRFLVRSLLREFGTAILLGASAGLLVALVAFFWKGRALVAVVIGCTILLSVVTACLVGVALPTLVRALRGDPKIAAGPMVLAIADVATLLLYLNLAAAMLPAG